MSPRKKKDNSPEDDISLIENPYHLKTIEIADLQDDSEEMSLEEQEATEGESHEGQNELNPFEIPESSTHLDEQFSQLKKAMDDRTEATMEALTESFTQQESTAQEADLAAQIAEDQALQSEIAQQLQEQEAALSAPQVEMSMDEAEIQSCIETLLFLSDKPLSTAKLRDMLGPQYSVSLFESAIQSLIQRYQSVHHGIELVPIAEGYQFRTKPVRASLAQKLVKIQTQRLSSGCMETLAIVAYRQPVMKDDVDKIRGVDSSYFIRTLLDKKLIQISGRSELPGRPMLYSTTETFMEVFGLADISSMPSLRELEQMIPGSQTGNPEDEDPRIREMRRLVGDMKSDNSSALYYNPKEDERILKDIKEQVNSIPTSTPYLEELKAAELAEKQARESAEEPQLLPEGIPLPKSKPISPV